jgi:N-hydroxyarylamine O-acetyltransferase
METIPKDHPFDLVAYCTRIGYEGPITQDLETLIGLSEAHARTIPYEDLEIHLGRSMPLEIAKLQRLMVAGGRGGYCFQMNLLFASALEAVGFNVSLLQGRVWLTSSGAVPPPAHLVLRIVIDGEPWLVDVGFGGGGMRRPIRMKARAESFQGGREFRLREDTRYGLMLERLDDGGWASQYSFDQRLCNPADFIHSNYFLSTSTESFFVQNRVCAIATELGETTLFNRTVRVRKGDEISDTKLEDAAQYTEALRAHFGIQLIAKDIAKLSPS